MLPIKLSVQRWAAIMISICALIIIFLSQEFQYGYAFAKLLNITISENTNWVITKTTRFILNDGFAILLVYGIFEERKYVLFAFLIQVLGFVFLLIPYIILFLSFSFQHEASLSYLHRIIVNPTLIMLLIPALLYQKYKGVNSNDQ